MTTPLDGFGAASRAWFEGAFEAPTAAQVAAWQAIRGGRHALVVAPTGSGKTLAAFLWALDQLGLEPPPADRDTRTRVLYVSPLKALAVDVERNLRAPLTGMRAVADRLGLPTPDLRVTIRTGDTPADERRRQLTSPPDILITTPESLYLLLTSQARERLAGVRTVIVDEVHAVAGTKRGAHLALSLERLDALLPRPAQRIGLSATVRPVDEVARFLGGAQPVDVVQPAERKPVELRVVVPVEDLTVLDDPDQGLADDAPRRPPSVWPHVEAHIVDLVAEHRSTIVFTNSRRLAERLAARLNEVWFERQAGIALPEAGSQAPAQVMAQSGATRGHDPHHEIARAHHGSVSREQRQRIEEDLKAGRLPAVVATSSLELGIDMGAVDLVVQVEPPPSVASGLQRVGRAEHRVDGVSRGVVFPKHRGDLVPTAVTVERMRAGQIEALHVPRNPLDVLAQQVVAMVAMDDWSVADLGRLVRRAAPFQQLPDSALESVLDMLAGRYPSDAFAELRPRLVWDRDADVLTARPGSHRLAVVNGGTIPDRGLFGVFLAGSDDAGRGGRRVGELDEEMVYESRVGDVFALGATSWRIEDITHDRVLVSPAPGQPGRLPFWHGDAVGRPAELGAALGAFVREVAALDVDAARARVEAAGLDAWATGNLLAYLAEQRDATGRLPDDRTIVVERFRDEIGDWRFAVHSPFGGQVHTPWALALAARMRDDLGLDVQVMPSDDGIVLRLPDVDLPDDHAPLLAERLLLDPDDVERAVTEAVAGSALFAARFRECAARSLLLPRRRPDRRTPLWQQRQRAAQLLGVASDHPTFPIVLETLRECLQDVFDVPALRTLMTDIGSGRVRVVEVETPQPSPFARSLLFSYVGAFLYEGDAPLAERRAQALALDTTLLAELLGQTELRELLDADAIAQVERELQWLAPERRVRDAEGVADLLRLLGPLDAEQLARRGAQPGWAEELVSQRRAVRVRLPSGARFAAVEDLGRLRDALGLPPPPGTPTAFLEPVADPVADLVSRDARTHGPFTVEEAAGRLGLGPAVVAAALARLATAGSVRPGQFRPGGSGTEWCDAEVLRRIRRRSLAVLRHQTEPVEPAALARFLPAWQSVGARLSGPDGVLRVVEQLQGCWLPASVLETQVLPARVADYHPGLLDALTATGEVVWAGHGSLPGHDGWVGLLLADDAPLLLAGPADDAALGDEHRRLLDALADGGALFFPDLATRAGLPPGSASGDPSVDALWDLVWWGQVTNDTLAPLRARLGGGRRVVSHPRPGRRPQGVRRAALPQVSGRWWRLPDLAGEPTRRAHAVATALLDRHGVLTRGAVQAERTPGGFGGVYRVLTAMEDSGRARRGYFVEGLGAAQFAVPGAVDRLRAPGRAPAGSAVVLAATDPANPYGAALPWPARPGDAGGHLPGRKAGAVVVLVDGELALYVERGGRSLLSWPGPEPRLAAAARGLAEAVRQGWLGRVGIRRADGVDALDSAVGATLEAAGFRATPSGLRLRPTR